MTHQVLLADAGGGAVVLLLFVLALYFIPSFIASGKKGAAGIVALNIFLGWTFLGWIAAFVWALAAERVPKPGYSVAQSAPNPGPVRNVLNVRLAKAVTADAMVWAAAHRGQPALLSKDGGLWHVDTEVGRLGTLTDADATKVSFRTEAVGKPKASFGWVGRDPSGPGTIADLEITFG